MKNAVKVLLAGITVMMALTACDKGSTKQSGFAIAYWAKGNNFYTQQKWDSAVNNYSRAIMSGAGDAAIYYNLGNAEYRLGRTGLAVLNYRRALFYKPDYTVASENLELVESRIPGRLQPAEPLFFVRWWAVLSSARYSAAWAIGALLLFTLAVALLWRRRQNKSGVAPQIIVAVFILWAISLIIAITSAQSLGSHVDAVVIRPRAMLRSEDGKQSLSVPEGTLVSCRKAIDQRVEVSLPDGRAGWLAAQDIGMVH